MTSFLRRDLEASVMWENAMAQQKELDNDPYVRAHRSINARRRPDLSNKSDTDVLEWLQRTETICAEFYEQYLAHPNDFEGGAEELCDLLKRAITVIQDMQERAGIDV